MSELLKKQNYGVEVEFTGITRSMAAKAVAEVIGSTVTGPDHTCYHTRIISFLSPLSPPPISKKSSMFICPGTL